MASKAMITVVVEDHDTTTEPVAIRELRAEVDTSGDAGLYATRGDMTGMPEMIAALRALADYAEVTLGTPVRKQAILVDMPIDVYGRDEVNALHRSQQATLTQWDSDATRKVYEIPPLNDGDRIEIRAPKRGDSA